jgi:hypothetical protein
MGIRRRHLLHSAVSIVVLVQLGFAAAFLADATQTNRTYHALAARHVAVNGHVQGCAWIGGQRGVLDHMCRVDYSFRGAEFSALIPYGQPSTYFVDPQNVSVRMSKVHFEGGPEETTFDIVFALLLVAGASVVTTVHLVHLRRKRGARTATTAGSRATTGAMVADG